MMKPLCGSEKYAAYVLFAPVSPGLEIRIFRSATIRLREKGHSPEKEIVYDDGSSVNAVVNRFVKDQDFQSGHPAAVPNSGTTRHINSLLAEQMPEQKPPSTPLPPHPPRIPALPQ